MVVPAENPDVVLVANGSDVALLVHAAEALKAEGVRARVVSVPPQVFSESRLRSIAKVYFRPECRSSA